VPYTIQKKETLFRISKKFDVSTTDLIKRNPSLKDGVKAGAVIYIPVKEEQKVLVSTEITDEKEVNALLSRKKDSKKLPVVNVSLLLPFMTEEAYPSSNTSRFIEYYEGFLLAVDSMRNQGCSINLSVFDTGNGTEKINDILKNPAVKEADLLIGAVQNEQIHPVAKFAEKNKIRYVIPFTSKNDDVLSNPYVFQVNTPQSYLYSKAAQAGCELFKNYNIIILKVNDPQDDKKEFIQELKTELKQKKVSYKEYTYNAETFATEIESQFVTDKPNVIIPTSGTLNALNKIKTPLVTISSNRPDYQLTLFGYPEWQTYTQDHLASFYELDTYFYSSFYTNNLFPEAINFTQAYRRWYSKDMANTFPKYGMLGFDTGYFFLKGLAQKGNKLEENLDKVQVTPIQNGFKFERVNNWGGFINRKVFFVHFTKDYELIKLDFE
jgi:LysM repeat protein